MKYKYTTLQFQNVCAIHRKYMNCPGLILYHS
uniref:Uncharacterized protein n=1 Tax=Anguilla anguilla TaxID=7936 RepID=A0A0E9RGY6_ANGAN